VSRDEPVSGEAGLLRRLRALVLALVLGVFPLLVGAVLEWPLAERLFGDWLLRGGPWLAGLLVGLLQELARLPAAAVLGALAGRLLGQRAARLVLGALLVGYGYYLALRVLTGTAAQLAEPGYLLGKLLGVAGVCLLGVRLARRSGSESP